MDDARLGAAKGPAIPLASIPPYSGSKPIAVFALGASLLVALAAWQMPGFAPGGAVRSTALFAGLGALCAGAGLVLLARWSPPPSGTLTLHENGFLFASPAGEKTALLFQEIESLALQNEQKLRYRVPSGLVQHATLQGPAGILRFRHFSNNRKDAVRAFFEQLQERLADAAEARLQAGGSLDGAGWSLRPDGLLWRPDERPAALSSLASTGLFQKRVAVWRQGEERAFFSVGAETPNARVLLRLLRRLLPRTSAPVQPGELGRVLFEVKSTKAPFGTVANALVAILGFWLAAALGTPGWQATGALIGLLGLYNTLHYARRWARTGRRHEHGLSMSTPWGDRKILFTDVQRFKYSTSLEYHSRYRNVTIKAWPTAGPPVILSKDVLGRDEDFLALRDLLMKQTAMQGERRSWPAERAPF